MAAPFKKSHEYGEDPTRSTYIISNPQPSTDEFCSSQPEHVSDTPVEKHASRNSLLKLQTLFWALRYFAVVVVVAALLMIPIALTKDDSFLEGEEQRNTRQPQNLVFYLFLWLEITWLAGTLADLFALVLPYLYRLLARYFNPAHQKYWRLFRALRRPIRIVGTLMFAYIGFAACIHFNNDLGVNFNKDVNIFNWDDVINDILAQVTLWVCFYFVEKVLIMFISLHFHYRSDGTKLAHSKDMHNTLVKLYEASTYLNPLNGGQFDYEDILIRNARGNEKTSGRVRVTSYLARLGIDGYKLTSLFGNFVDDDPKSHWLRPASSYATVERALSDPKTAAALARRIWVSLVGKGSESLTADDIAEVLGPYRKDEALQCFKVLDENESGDLRLDEMVMTVVEAGRIRHDIYQHMHDADHCINTFDWVCLTILAAVMVFFIMVLYVPTLKEIQSTLSFLALGLSFAVGRTFNHFLQGVVLVFFDHPFDIGDRVEIYNMAASISVAAVVKRQSLLYTIFRRLDNGADLQISNERLIQKRIENITRSGINRQALSLFVSFKTSFEDMVFLRRELEAFLAENKRDYMPDLGLSIVNLHELNKIELRCSVAHKSNWSNERLRAARSNRFYCALVAAVRKVPLDKPGGPLSLGEEGKPMFTVPLTDEAAGKQVQDGVQARAAARIDAEKGPTEEVVAKGEREHIALATLQKMPLVEKINALSASTAIEINEFIGISTTGMRNKPNGGAEMIFMRP